MRKKLFFVTALFSLSLSAAKEAKEAKRRRRRKMTRKK